MILQQKELDLRKQEAAEILKSCNLCPRECKVNRLKGEKGFCQAGKEIKISASLAHFGEEPFLSGSHGSGTIFFSHCNLRCKFCQNYQISHQGRGKVVTDTELAEMMLILQKQGCHNINFVSPTHYVPQILNALSIAVTNGLKIPLVYNTNGYDSLQTLKLLDGIIDLYLPDIKYDDNQTAFLLSQSPEYRHHNRQALREMLRQVGNLSVNKNGIAKRGLVIRHLVLPRRKAGSFEALQFLAKDLNEDVQISLMAQYYPCHEAETDLHLNRCLTSEEYEEVVAYALKLGLTNILTQELTSPAEFLPDFTKEKPFPVRDLCEQQNNIVSLPRN